MPTLLCRENLRRLELRFDAMKCAALLAVAVLVLFGCSKKSEPATPQQSGEAPAPGAPPPKYVTAAAQNAPAENVSGEVNAFLTQQLRIFISEKGRTPSDFAELARARLDSVPRPPEGKKWVIDNATKEVKAAQTQ
jgi:PBP1b-binding outer membrane lipoprotein LpoB